MNGRRNSGLRAAIFLMFLLCLVGGGALALQRAYPEHVVRRLSAGDVTAPAQLETGKAGDDNAVRATAPIPESQFAVIALRPLFSPDRRPPEEAPEEVVVEAAPGAPELLVTGIVSAGEDSVAIFEPTRSGGTSDGALVSRAGGTVAGWTVEAIESDRVVLTRNGERHELPLIEEDDPRRAPVRRLTPPAGLSPTQQRQLQLQQQQQLQFRKQQQQGQPGTAQPTPPILQPK